MRREGLKELDRQWMDVGLVWPGAVRSSVSVACRMIDGRTNPVHPRLELVMEAMMRGGGVSCFLETGSAWISPPSPLHSSRDTAESAGAAPDTGGQVGRVGGVGGQWRATLDLGEERGTLDIGDALEEVALPRGAENSLHVRHDSRALRWPPRRARINRQREQAHRSSSQDPMGSKSTPGICKDSNGQILTSQILTSLDDPTFA